jgi:chemotaxis protein CheD
MSKTINVFAGEMAVGQNDVIIKTGGVGSCLIICLYDKINKIGGLAHAMLPSCESYGKIYKQTKFEPTSAKFVDKAIERLIQEMENVGSEKANMRAKLVGGAEMIKIFSANGRGLGPKNIEVARKVLSELKIQIESESVGGTVGRLVELNVNNGVLDVSSKM